MGREDLGGVEIGKTIIRIYHTRNFFQLKKMISLKSCTQKDPVELETVLTYFT